TFSSGGHIDSVGTNGERDSMMMAMTWGFDLELGPNCAGGFAQLNPPSNADTSFVKIWEHHYGGSQNEQLFDIVEAKHDCGGYLLVGTTQSQAEDDVTDSL